MNSSDMKQIVRKKYGQAATRVKSGRGGCCSASSAFGAEDPITKDLYSPNETALLPEEAVLASLGCGNPTALAELIPGETVLDLGSGGGIDVLLSARRVGPGGKAYGLDMTDEMLSLARENQHKAGVENVEFLKGEIEKIHAYRVDAQDGVVYSERRMTTRETPLPDFPANLLEFQRMFPDEAACLRYLEQVRWPKGFVCPYDGSREEPYRFKNRPTVLRCRTCRRNTRLTAHTVMHRTKQRLDVWFWAAYLVATSTPGISALEIQKKLGVKTYETAFQVMHKLRSAMVRPDRDKIGAEWPMEMDIAFVGGKHKGGRQGVTKQTPVIVAVEIRRGEVRDPVTHKIQVRGYAGRIRLRKLPNKSAAGVDKFVQDCIAHGALITTDDGLEYTNLKGLGYIHQAVAIRGDRAKVEAWLPMVHVVIGNLKTWIDGTFHGVRKKHFQAYLNEFMFRFNRRFYRNLSFRSLLGIGVHQEGPTYDALYRGDWDQRANTPASPAMIGLDDGGPDA